MFYVRECRKYIFIRITYIKNKLYNKKETEFLTKLLKPLTTLQNLAKAQAFEKKNLSFTCHRHVNTNELEISTDS